MSKKENVAGLLGWQSKAQAHRKTFFRSQTKGGYHDSCDLIWKIAFTFVEKIGGDIFKADSAQSKRNETRIGIKLEKLETCPEIINLLLSKCSLILEISDFKHPGFRI